MLAVDLLSIGSGVFIQNTVEKVPIREQVAQILLETFSDVKETPDGFEVVVHPGYPFDFAARALAEFDEWAFQKGVEVTVSIRIE